jgi:hypothetical protein
MVFTQDTRIRDREKRLGQTHLFNIWTIGARERTYGRPPGQAEHNAQCISFKNSTTADLTKISCDSYEDISNKESFTFYKIVENI